ncbi:ADP-ribosylhydrolase ARH3 [Parasteatoda tepidariorum]|uniref:ADP-ribosylhydrolase ARH3 n=1 Tax=Parasteatoda tepidariorum TaxID=114398 RepID=UPI001C71F718|nr:ADP-ribose glycohydrolase ARH3-like [Parasteatoda tepidariorum]
MATAVLASAGLAAKFRGCLIGSLIGDCLGAPFEGDFPISKSVLGNFFTNILNGETKQMLPYTDDTAMTLSVAKSLIENKKICPIDLAKRFVNVYFDQPTRGYGMNVLQVFETLKETEFQDVFLPAKMQFNGSGSYGNGAAMRIAPVALFAHDKEDDFIKNAVEQCSSVTHTHPNGYNGAILQCLAVHSALKLDSSKELDPIKFISELEEKMKKIETQSKTPYCDSLKKIREIYLKKQEDMSSEEVAKYLGNDVSALKSVPTAIYSFL